jgi:hypothetical protein
VVTLPLSPGVVAAVVVVVVMVAAAQLVEITAPETVDPPYKALTRSSAAPSPNHNVLREERPAKSPPAAVWDRGTTTTVRFCAILDEELLDGRPT